MADRLSDLRQESDIIKERIRKVDPLITIELLEDAKLRTMCAQLTGMVDASIIIIKIEAESGTPPSIVNLDFASRLFDKLNLLLDAIENRLAEIEIGD